MEQLRVGLWTWTAPHPEFVTSLSRRRDLPR
jgi:hypothetical protein